MSLREAGRQLGRSPHYIKGYAEALGIKLEPASRSLFMTKSDFDRIKQLLGEESKASTLHHAAV